MGLTAVVPGHCMSDTRPLEIGLHLCWRAELLRQVSSPLGASFYFSLL